MNRRYSLNRWASSILRDIANQVIRYDISISIQYIRGSENSYCDAISRLHKFGEVVRFQSLLNVFHAEHPIAYWLPWHMSLPSLNFLLPTFRKMKLLCKNWTSNQWSLRRTLLTGTPTQNYPVCQLPLPAWARIALTPRRSIMSQ